MEFKRKKKTRLYENIVEQIQSLIKEGSLAPGDQLLPERQLAEKLGVSRTAVREALTALASRGIIEITPGGGAYVKEISIESLIDPLATILLGEKENVSNLLEARKIIEVEVVKLAALRANKTDLYQIREAALEMERDVESLANADESDVNFHLAIARAANNNVLYNIMQMLSGLMREAYGPSRRKLLTDQEKAKEFCRQNFAIYEAIKDKDADRAKELMKKHLVMAEKDLSLTDDENTPVT